jgi:hypothetical protein
MTKGHIAGLFLDHQLQINLLPQHIWLWHGLCYNKGEFEIWSEKMQSKKYILSIMVLALATLFLISSVAVAQEVTDKKVTASKSGKLIIKSKSGAKVTVSKAELSTRPGSRSAKRESRRLSPAEVDPTPTTLKLYFPTLVYPGDEVKGKLKFNDKDDFIFSIFITVFFPDGDVVTSTLYDYRDEGGDIYKGTYTFYVEIPESETPLPGKIVITCSDEYLNVSEVTQTFIQSF